MDDLIEALIILGKYGNPEWPTHCEHDVMKVMIDPADVSDYDKHKLNILGFFPDDEYDVFMSLRFGSC